MPRILLAALGVVSLIAQTAPPQTARRQPQGASGAPQQAEPGFLRGTITGPSGEPLRKAEVTLRTVGGGMSGARAGGFMGPGMTGAVFTRTTDAAGAFSFDEIPPGSYVLSAQRTGYVRTEYGARPGSVRQGGSTLRVSSGQTVNGITLKMIPQAVLSGRVLDEDGDPILHASVQLLRERWVNGRRQHLPMNTDATDDRGEYRISGLMPGKYIAMANTGRSAAQGAARTPGSPGDLNYTSSYYPGVQEISQATPIQLASGQEMSGIDFQLRRATTWRVRGRVLDESGKPAMYVAVMAVPADGGYLGVRSMGAVRNPEGTFEIAGLPPGSYTLIVNQAGRQQPRKFANTPVQVGNRDLDGVIVQLQSAFDVSGIVRIAGEGVQLGTPRVVMEPLDPGIPFAGGNDGGVKPDGTWSLSGLSSGRYRISISGLPEGTYLKSVLAGGQDVTAGAQISSAATGIQLVLGAKAPEVSGTVLNADKEPVPASTVVLVPDSSQPDQYWRFKTAASDDSGAFRIQGIVPGQYTAYALIDVEDGIWNDPDFLRTLQGKGTAVKLEEGSNETLQLAIAR